jgi:hypothetical protein
MNKTDTIKEIKSNLFMNELLDRIKDIHNCRNEFPTIDDIIYEVTEYMTILKKEIRDLRP